MDEQGAVGLAVASAKVVKIGKVARKPAGTSSSTVYVGLWGRD